ncbi:TIM barrel protein [Flavivirga amylovorans]|uniref:TIM barrel protein n=1 Tax=Flavivirga amylovorans TaxID=870486 RepID=A0ABT8X574_9FLAO|nr:TIM barrel protein [Flavivirga amylovorans]MDO5989031.1 TIM barrel protein [Flavivirga amylovorans]
MKPITRRTFTKKSSLVLGAIPFLSIPCNVFANKSIKESLSVNIFSKHLQFLNYKDAGEVSAELGFQGLDLTVRPKGHVLPESVTKDLPKAIEDIRKGGSNCTMMTTAITDSANKTDIDILKTASKYGIKYYRTNWFKYSNDNTMEADLEYYQQNVKGLSKLNKELSIIGCYQNHAGKHSIGASIWEIKKLLEFADLDYFGAQYDIRHAQVEGGLSWENGIKLIKKSIKTIVLKDFKWGQINGIWKPINTPIGEGMVDFKTYFSLLKKYQINVPVSLHLEYNLGGAEKGHKNITIDKKTVFSAMKKDLETIQILWKEA